MHLLSHYNASAKVAFHSGDPEFMDSTHTGMTDERVCERMHERSAPAQCRPRVGPSTMSECGERRTEATKLIRLSTCQ